MLRYISPLPGGRQWPRALSVLGSTGSIGRSALAVLRLQPEAFRVAALACGRNIALLAEQAAEFRPAHLGLLDEKDLPALRRLLPTGYAPAIVCGQSGYETLAALPGVSMLLSAQVGAAGLRATVAAALAGKIIALANKEALVLAGSLIREICARTGAAILPVDSEHNAIFQCISASLAASSSASRAAMNAGPGMAGPGAPPVEPFVRKLILTASGGPFFGKSRAELEKVSLDAALAHPNWSMGPKITVDSATLMNKGLELIEAHHLYGLPMSDLEVLVHKESIIHSLVEFSDGSQLAQLGQPDMRIPIANCLGWPERVRSGAPRLNLAQAGSLTFASPDESLFPCLALARRAQEHGRGSPVALSAANEEAVAAFLDRRIAYLDIARVVEKCLNAHHSGFSCHSASSEPSTIEEILAIDAEARIRAREFMRKKPGP